jgi:hypothetical protein
MHPARGEAVQRVCPSCSIVAYTAERRCPWCGAGYMRRIWPALLAAALLQAAIVLGGVALILAAAGEELDRRLDVRVRAVERDIDATLAGVERAVREELDRRLPPAP